MNMKLKLLVKGIIYTGCSGSGKTTKICEMVKNM